MIKLPLGAWHFIKAWDLFAKGKNVEAEIIFEKGEKYIPTLTYSLKIQKGNIKWSLDKDKECIDLYLSAWSDIEKDKELSEADKLYLQFYMSGFLELYKKYLQIELGNISLIKGKDVPLETVSKRWIRNFPSRDHPDWDKYGEPILNQIRA